MKQSILAPVLALPGGRRLLERLTLALLRRLTGGASPQFRDGAMNVAADGLVEQLLCRRDQNGFVTVEAGPFAGLRLLTRSRTTGHIAKVLGVYESQLVPVLQHAAARQPALVVNIGCGDGYYLAAAGRLLPQARLVGFDANPTVQQEARAVLRENGMADRAAVEGFCDSAALARVLDPAAVATEALLIVDCEGGEAELLDPQRVPALRRTAMIVELHEFAAPGVTDLLRGRFGASHRIEIVDQRQALPEAADVIALPETLALAVVSERRGQLMQWAWLEPLDINE